MNSILINDYLRILNQSGWQETHIFQALLSSERFKANVVSAMQKRKIIGVTSRYVIISRKNRSLTKSTMNCPAVELTGYRASDLYNLNKASFGEFNPIAHENL